MTSLWVLVILTAVPPATGTPAASPVLAHSALQVPETPPATSTPAATADTVFGTLRGRILSGHGAAPLSRAVVELRLPSGPRFAVTDASGHYLLDEVPEGEHLLRAAALDHAPLEVTARVGPGSTVELDLSLELRPIGLPPLLAAVDTAGWPGVSTFLPRPGQRSRGLRETELRALESSPGMAELGLGDRALPGEPDPDPSSVLYVRGAASDLKLVLLDGAPVYAPFHLGGLMEAFQPEVLQQARLWVGGAPARFDGGLSYVLDLRTRSGATDRLRTSGAADLLGARTQVEGPAGPGSFLVGGRAVHGAVHQGLTGEPLPYEYADALVRADLPVGVGSGLSATGFWNREAVSLEAVEGMDEPAYWGNLAGSLRWHGPLGEGRLEIIAATGDFSTRLPLSGDSARVTEGDSRRSRLEALYAQRAGRTDVAAGLSLERLAVDLSSRPVGRISLGGTAVPAPEELAASLSQARAAGTALGAFADVGWSPASDLDVRAGLRADAFMTERRMRLAPRAGAAWRPAETTTLSLAAGRFHQYVRTPETVLAADLESWATLEGVALSSEEEPEARAGALLAVVGASHLVFGLENRVREDISLGLEAFLKTYDGLPAAEGLRSSGADVWVQRAGDRWTGWLGYSIGWAWTEGGPDRNGVDFAGRHLLSGGLGADLPGTVQLDVAVAYGSGLPFTPIPRTTGATGVPESADGPPAASVVGSDPGGAALAGAPDGSYLRLDGRVSRTWMGRVYDHPFELTPYVKLLNALDRRDALFYHFDPERDLRPRSLAAVPLLPVVGLEWRY